MGAGSVGCWVGGCLAAAGAEVVLVGRQRVIDAVRAHGLTLTALDGSTRSVDPSRLAPCTAVPPGVRPQLVLLCVKSGATAAAAAALAAALPPGTPLLSLQNGLHNAEVAARAAPSLDVAAGIVGFNVAEIGPGRFHRGTDGALAAEDRPVLRALGPAFAAAGLPLTLHADLRGLQWGKLLLNLNNPVNALVGLPLRTQLLDRACRRVTAALQDEALALLDAAGIAPARLTPLPAHRIPALLRLPTPLFRLLALRMLRIDPQARSSMADDLALGRGTEIDALCGEIVRLAGSLGRAAPRNARIAELVEQWPQSRTRWSGERLCAELGVA